MIGLLAGLALALSAAGADAPTYEDLVAEGVAMGRQQRYGEAASAFSRALALAPRRPEAWVERGGLRFLEGEYTAAAEDLARALRLREDEYTRDLLASSLALAGRGDEALRHWNALGQPTLRHLELKGLQRTRFPSVRREIMLEEGQRLDLGRLEESRLRLQELGIFNRVTLRPVAQGGGAADLEVAVIERPAVFAGPADLVGLAVVGLVDERVGLRYTNVGGHGVSAGVQYRWNRNRPDLSLALDWPRPLGLDAHFHVQGFRGRQAYALATPLTRRSRGLDAGLRRVLGGRTVGQLGVKLRNRSFSRPDPAAPPGRIVGVDGGLEHRVVETHRGRVDAWVRGFHAWKALGSDLPYGRMLLGARARVHLAPPDSPPLDRSALVGQLQWGWGGRGMPLDEMFAPGGAFDSVFPLRGHHQAPEGVLGSTPIGRTLQLANVEWRRRLWNRDSLQAGIVLFVDTGRVGDAVPTRLATPFAPRTLVDAGLGLRIALKGAAVVRIDVGHGLRDGENAVFLGLGQTF